MALDPRPALDLAIRDALVVDGTGSPAFRGDLGVRDGRIAAVGRVDGQAAREVAAAGRALAPGFVDLHTHYDAQLCWDGLATPSPLHGVTTVVTGNCSLSVAPVRGDGARRVVGMFQTIEDIGAATFAAAVPFSWESFDGWLAHLRGRLGVNLAPLVGHSTLRLYAMGEASQQRPATDAELDAMCALLREAVAAGARGLSLSHLDRDEDLRPVPSRFADLREKKALARAVVEAGGTLLETVPQAGDEREFEACVRELGEISRETGIVATLQPILYYPPLPDLWKRSLDWLEAESRRGARIYGQTTPRSFDMNLRLDETFFTFFLIPSWGDVMRRPAAERAALLRDPARRPALVEEGAPILGFFLEKARIGDTRSAANAPLRGRRLPEIARERGIGLVDALLEVALADDLATEFRIEAPMHGDPAITAQILSHPNVVVGASDAGAHLSQICGAGDTTALLATFVRERGDLSLEAGVHRVTGQPAELLGLRDVGRLAPGLAADLVLFDPARIALGAERYVRDVPGGANRYLRAAVGVDSVWVAGEPISEAGRYTDARPGRVL
jgi:N-acyl-D-aspartate/D-glutamate deacylase